MTPPIMAWETDLVLLTKSVEINSNNIQLPPLESFVESGVSPGLLERQDQQGQPTHQLEEENSHNIMLEDVKPDYVQSQIDSISTKEVDRELEAWGREEVDKKNKVLSTEELAAILESSLEQTSVRRGKCQAGNTDVDVGTKAE
jgi:hypothetical protein